MNYITSMSCKAEFNLTRARLLSKGQNQEITSIEPV